MKACLAARLPRLGGDKDFVINLSDQAKEAASALGWRDFCQLLGDFPVEGKLLELCEGKVTKAVLPSYEVHPLFWWR